MDYRKIAHTILETSDDVSLLLTDAQIQFLAETIEELPDEQQQWLIDHFVFKTDIDETGQKIFDTLRSNLRLRAILSLGSMDISSLIDIVIYALAGDYEISLISDPNEGRNITFKGVQEEAAETKESEAEQCTSCKLCALFEAIIGTDATIKGSSAYAEALKIFEEQLGPQQPVAFSVKHYTALRRSGIKTNADLIRWYLKDPIERPRIAGIGKKGMTKITEYIEFWFSRQKQKLLHSKAPH